MHPRRGALHKELQQSRPVPSRREEAFIALLRTAAVVRRPVMRVMERRGISIAQYNVLRILRGAGGTGLPTLAIRQRMIEDAAGITRLIDKLERAGLVARDRLASADRRRVFCRITPQGLALLSNLDVPVATATGEALAGLGDDRLDELLALLDALCGAHPRTRIPASLLLELEEGVSNGAEGEGGGR